MRFARPATAASTFVFAIAHSVALLWVGCSQGDSGSPEGGGPADGSSAADASQQGPEAGAPEGGAGVDGGEGADSGGDGASTDAATQDADDPVADCLQAGSPPDGGESASNAYMQSCGGASSSTTTAQDGNPCTIGVVGQHCFLQCAFCNGFGSSSPSSLLLPCSLPINNCCGVLTCGGCPACL